MFFSELPIMHLILKTGGMIKYEGTRRQLHIIIICSDRIRENILLNIPLEI